MELLTEKFHIRGAAALSDEELLTLLLEDAPQAATIAAHIMEHYSGSLLNISREDLSRLRMVEGIGLKRAQRLILSAEFGRRCSQGVIMHHGVIKGSDDIINLFRPHMQNLNFEECWIIYLTAANHIVESQRVSQGGITATIVDHRLVIKRALELLATQIIMIHNHPSGSVQPSKEDIELTQKIKSAAALFDINLLDHIIISRSQNFSFLSSKLL
ncbi:MAG: DNA repair protein RadC [Rikenellaceae bacterium]